MKKLLTAFFLLAAATAASFASASVEGSYTLDAAAITAAIEAMPEYQSAPPQGQQMMKSMFNSFEFSLTLADGKWEASSKVMGNTETSSGTYEVSDDQLTIVTKIENGQALAEDDIQTVTIKDDTLILKEEGAPFALVFKKVASH